MTKRVQVTLTESQYEYLVAISEYTGSYNLSSTLRLALDAAIDKYEDNDTFNRYLEDVRRRKKK
ncbi:hypothetical protein AB6M97_01930 [Streptococcus hillyeri]|uniref:hypothetical protein n=1 Tax=Streptococcus hillyeri TaxID=2282420 RepID=UPI0034E2AE2B